MSWHKNDILGDRPCLNKQEIEAYIQKSLSQTQRFSVENHLLDCPLCDAAIDGYVNNTDALLENQSVLHKSRKLIYLVAATLLMLLGATAFFNYQSHNQPDRTFTQYYEKPSWNTQTRGSDKTTTYSDAVQLYNEGQHQAAIEAFEPLLETNSEDNQLRLYKGIAHLESSQYAKAENEFTVVRVNSELFFEEATWYLAMLNIKLDQKQEAISYLEELINLENGFFNSKAREIKKRLQN